MGISTDNLIRVVKAGGNLSVDAEKMSTDNIIRVTQVVVQMGGSITFRNLSSKSTDNLIRVKLRGQVLH